MKKDHQNLVIMCGKWERLAFWNPAEGYGLPSLLVICMGRKDYGPDAII